MGIFYSKCGLGHFNQKKKKKYAKETLTVLHTLKFILAKFSLVSFPMFQKSIADKICNATAKIIGLRLYLH